MDSRDGGRPVESVIMKELIGRVDNTFRTIPDREHRAVEGFAMGGWGAAHLGFKYPEVFGVVSIVSAQTGTFDFFLQEGPQLVSDVWGNDRSYFEENDPFVLAQKNQAALCRGRTKVRILCSAEDRYAILADDLHRQLESLEIEHWFLLVPGVQRELGHVLAGARERAMTFWKDVFPPYVPPPEPPATTRAATGPSTENAMP
jgi:endo-1,4-beta-xylanase